MKRLVLISVLPVLVAEVIAKEIRRAWFNLAVRQMVCAKYRVWLSYWRAN
ncbi:MULTISPECIES: hypothetical protein [Pseudomonadaceae]|nr:hypothetical protein [Pseudomonas aeruginosa]